MDFKASSQESVLKRIDLSGMTGFLLNFLAPLISLVAIGGLVFSVLLPSYKSIPKLKAQLSSKKNLGTQLERKVSVLNLLIDLKPVVEENLNLVNKTLVSDPKIPELLAQVDQMVEESNLEVDQLGYSRGGISSDATGYDSIAVALSSTGSGEGLLEFLRKVENASRFVLIDDFRFSKNKQEGELGFAASFKLLSLYLSVQSDAVTDESIELNISEPEFLGVMEDLKSLHHYAISPEELITDVKETTLSEEVELGGTSE